MSQVPDFDTAAGTAHERPGSCGRRELLEDREPVEAFAVEDVAACINIYISEEEEEEEEEEWDEEEAIYAKCAL